MKLETNIFSYRFPLKTFIFFFIVVDNLTIIDVISNYSVIDYSKHQWSGVANLTIINLCGNCLLRIILYTNNQENLLEVNGRITMRIRLCTVYCILLYSRILDYYWEFLSKYMYSLWLVSALRSFTVYLSAVLCHVYS